MFVIDDSDGACPSYYTYNVRFAHIWGSLWFWPPSKMLDTLKYFGLSTFASRIDADAVLKSMAFHRCGEVDWEKTSLKYGFLSYDRFTGEGHGNREESVQKREACHKC